MGCVCVKEMRALVVSEKPGVYVYCTTVYMYEFRRFLKFNIFFTRYSMYRLRHAAHAYMYNARL